MVEDVSVNSIIGIAKALCVSHGRWAIKRSIDRVNLLRLATTSVGQNLSIGIAFFSAYACDVAALNQSHRGADCGSFRACSDTISAPLVHWWPLIMREEFPSASLVSVDQRDGNNPLLTAYCSILQVRGLRPKTVRVFSGSASDLDGTRIIFVRLS